MNPGPIAVDSTGIPWVVVGAVATRADMPERATKDLVSWYAGRMRPKCKRGWSWPTTRLSAGWRCPVFWYAGPTARRWMSSWAAIRGCRKR